MSFSSRTTRHTNKNRANKSGARLEAIVRTTLEGNDYQEYLGTAAEKTLFLATPKLSRDSTYRNKWFAEQMPVGKTVFGNFIPTPEIGKRERGIRKADFYVFNKLIFPKGLIIECKWQQSGGSVDEKLPSVVLNIDNTGIDTIILLDGTGWRPGFVPWLYDQVNSVEHLLAVYNMREFQTAVNNELFTNGRLVRKLRNK